MVWYLSEKYFFPIFPCPSLPPSPTHMQNLRKMTDQIANAKVENVWKWFVLAFPTALRFGLSFSAPANSSPPPPEPERNRRLLHAKYRWSGPDLTGGGPGAQPREGGCPLLPPKKNSGKKYFSSGKRNVKFGHISGKYCVKFEHFVNFSWEKMPCSRKSWLCS